jgi:hypothetical protein
MSLLVFLRGLAGAARPVAGDFILNLGPAFAFAFGSFVLLGAVPFLRSVNPDAALSQLPPDTAISERVSITALGLVAVTGMAAAWGSRAMGEQMLPHVFQTKIAGVDSKLLMAGFSLALVFASMLAGVIAVRWGNQRTLLGGLVATAVLLLIMVFSQGFVMVAATVLAVIFTNSLIITAVVPFVLSLSGTSAPGRIGRRVLFWWFFPGDDFLLCSVCGTQGGSCCDNGDCRGDSLRHSCTSRLFACWFLCRRGRSA